MTIWIKYLPYLKDIQRPKVIDHKTTATIIYYLIIDLSWLMRLMGIGHNSKLSKCDYYYFIT